MKIKMLSIWASPKGTHQVGEVLEIDDVRGKTLIDDHHAEKVADDTALSNKGVNHNCHFEDKVVAPGVIVPATPLVPSADLKVKPAKPEVPKEAPKVDPIPAPATKVETVEPKVDAK